MGNHRIVQCKLDRESIGPRFESWWAHQTKKCRRCKASAFSFFDWFVLAATMELRVPHLEVNPQLAECFGFDLAYSFSRYIEHTTYLF